MAIDTPNKRRSAVPQFLPLMLVPVPDNNIAGSDRRQITSLYSSILIKTSALVRTFTVKRLVQDSDRTVKILVRDSKRKLKILWDEE